MRNRRILVGLMLVCMAWAGGTQQGHAHIHQHPTQAPIKPVVPDKREKSMLQELIDETEPGGTLLLEGRAYRGPMSITKPIKIKGVEGTEIHSLATALTISDTADVELEDLMFQAEDVAIVASNVQQLTLANITIEDSMAGIQITDSENITLQQLEVTGKEGHFSDKGHAVAVYDTKNVTATGSRIDGVMDGFYLESVDGVHLSDNRVENGRYAMHMMYSDQVELYDNELFNNMTGFMVMIANDVQIAGNVVAKNNTLNSLGVYAYDVENVQFHDNEVTENTTAMDIQNARDMVVGQNTFSTNGTVLQVKRSGELLVEDNEFHGNILTARTDRQGLKLRHNFYDDYDGKDYDGDGIGDTAYIATNSFGQWMARKPVYQYFMESPSVVTLNMMDTEVTGGNTLVIVDEQPLVMKSPFSMELDINIWQLLGSGLVVIGILVVRRRLR
ncbi:MAG: nitrous oxide reductase family maturation protein NosD [Lysinibacillus sp.]